MKKFCFVIFLGISLFFKIAKADGIDLNLCIKLKDLKVNNEVLKLNGCLDVSDSKIRICSELSNLNIGTETLKLQGCLNGEEKKQKKIDVAIACSRLRSIMDMIPIEIEENYHYRSVSGEYVSRTVGKVWDLMDDIISTTGADKAWLEKEYGEDAPLIRAIIKTAHSMVYSDASLAVYDVNNSLRRIGDDAAEAFKRYNCK